jgi:fructoselysine 6-kinase
MHSFPSIAHIGDLTVDKYVETKEVRLGGGALNGALWARRSGARASVVTAIGTDDPGELFLKKLKKEKINGSHIQKITGETSGIEIFVGADGERRYGTWNPGTLAHYHLRVKDIAFLKKQDAVCVTIYPPFRHVLHELSKTRSLRRKKPTLVINYGDLKEFDKDLTVVTSHLRSTDIAVFGLDKDEDEGMINELRVLAKSTKKQFLITLGKYGSLLYDGDEVFTQAAREVKAKDTTGAGDSFLAGFLVSYLKDYDIQKALARGSSLAARVIQKVGAY